MNEVFRSCFCWPFSGCDESQKNPLENGVKGNSHAFPEQSEKKYEGSVESIVYRIGREQLLK